MTTRFDCGDMAEVLENYLEDDAPAGVRAAVEAHAAGCSSCRSLLDDIAMIRRDAAALPMLSASRDLWSGIAARIETPVVSLNEKRVVKAWPAWAKPSLAAAALVIVTASITHVLTRASVTAAPATNRVATVPSVVTPPAPDPAPAAASTTEIDRPAVTARATTRLVNAMPAMAAEAPMFRSEIGKLRSIVNERRSQLDPSTVAVLERSIVVIDSAIAESRAALRRDPASGFLASQLNHSLEKKVELLRTAASLPARS